MDKFLIYSSVGVDVLRITGIVLDSVLGYSALKNEQRSRKVKLTITTYRPGKIFIKL